MSKLLKVAVGLSGGVDSSVAALLLKQSGYDVVGVFLKCWDEKADGCTAEEDRISAVTVASQLDIKFDALDFSKEYAERVISYFYEEYKRGRTPNPDVMCNKEIKFGLFLEWAIANNFDYIATGHYARVDHFSAGPSVLLTGKDLSKDQSYFLYRLKQQQLKKALFPIGHLLKSEVREIAKKHNLSTYNRPDSQGICFIGKVNIKDFLQKTIKNKKGKVVHVDGSIIGTHDGVWYYTIGQRHGFEVDKYYGLPLYVVDKKVDENILVVGFANNVVSDNFVLHDLTWLAESAPLNFENTKIRIRHLGKLSSATITWRNEGELSVLMEDSAFGIAPGQSGVLYRDDVVLGGGIIL